MSAPEPPQGLLVQLQAENAQLRKLLLEAQARIAELETRNAELHTRLAELQATLRRHFPPSSGPRVGSTPPPRNKGKRRRRRGAQPGHPDHQRTLIPLEQVTRIQTHVPSVCSHCQAPLGGLDPEPLRHQVVELPPIAPQVTEYRLHQLRCTVCGSFTRASLPPGVSESSFGPRLTALGALCTGSYRMSKRSVEQFLRDVLNRAPSQTRSFSS